MGLRFRKSITLCKGVKVNFGKTGASLSVGVPGLHRTYHTSGRKTTSVGIPGTGLSYVDIDNSGTNRARTSSNRRQSTQYADEYMPQTPCAVPNTYAEHVPQPPRTERHVDRATITAIHAVADEPVDWTEVLINDSPVDSISSEGKWSYYHSVAEAVLEGDIDTYLRVIQDVNPYDDLLDYGGNFIFGTDAADKMVVEFTTKSNECMPPKASMPAQEYNQLLCDYICSCSLRVARDTFALLPVNNVIVHVVDAGRTILSVDFDRDRMTNLRFRFAEPTDAVKLFQPNMSFDVFRGFAEVSRINT